ncbi:MAG: glyoxylate/hydroxypyruvate reductase A [Kangiella sp.]|nr:MAG: glyoxylate/hydroxypyruvate reductase A [Kangiella sp.]
MKPIIPFVSNYSLEEKTEWLNQLQIAMPEERVVLAENIDVIELDKTEIAIVADPDLDLLKSLKSLKWVQTLSAGVEGLIAVAKSHNFQIVRMIDPNLSNAMAESVLTWALFIKNKIPTYLLQQKNKNWNQLNYQPANKCKIGILGLGAMGKASANKLLKNNFQVLGWSHSKNSIDGVTTFYGENGLIDFVRQCQILICLLPLTNETKGFVDTRLLRELPEGASVINFSRGGLLVTNDLLVELDDDHIYHAILDVFDQEPLPVDNCLWSNPKVTILPHVAAITDPNTATVIVAKNVKGYRDTGSLRKFVDLSKGY